MPQMKLQPLRQLANRTGLVFLFAVFAVAAFPALLGDFLLYRSDPFSLSVIVFAAALFLLPPCLPMAHLIGKFLPPSRFSAERWAALSAAVIILDIFLALCLLYLVHLLNIEGLNKSIKHPIHALVICIIPAAAAVYFQSDKAGLIARVRHVGLAALVVAPVLIAYSIIAGGLAVTTGTPRHLALVVLDGWPSQYLHAYNASAPPSPLDDLLPSARVYTGAHTSAAWTSAYFGALYNADAFVVAGEGRNRTGRKSLARTLQDNGVAVRLANFHRNGIPDTSYAHRSDHKGLRSYFLTENYAWVPRALGLDYHLSLAGAAIGQNLELRYQRALFDWLNPVPDTELRTNSLIDILAPALVDLRKHSDRTFALFHIAWSHVGHGGDSGLPEVPVAQVADASPGNSKAAIRANDYRYDTSNEAEAARLRQTMTRNMLEQTRYIRDFITLLRSDQRLSDTVIILTADHGSMYAKGRYWYGFHPNREVVRVPFIVFDEGPKGMAPQLFATPQLANAISRFFTGSPSETVFSVEGAGDAPVLSLTLKSDVHNEWYLVASYPGHSYWMNLHPDGTGRTLDLSIDGYEQRERMAFDGPPRELADGFGRLLRSLGLDPEDVHQAFR